VGIDQNIQLEWYDTWLKGQDIEIAETRTPMQRERPPRSTYRCHRVASSSLPAWAGPIDWGAPDD
jgi:hypothetical protein